MTDNNFGEKLKKLRKDKGYTQAQLAEKIAMSEKHLSKIEQNVYFPKVPTIKKILQALDLKIEDIGLNLENAPKSSLSQSYTKILQILNSSNEQEIEYFYRLIKQAKGWTGK